MTAIFVRGQAARTIVVYCTRGWPKRLGAVAVRTSGADDCGILHPILPIGVARDVLTRLPSSLAPRR